MNGKSFHFTVSTSSHLQQGRAVCSTVLLPEVVVGPELPEAAEEEAAFVDRRAVLV